MDAKEYLINCYMSKQTVNENQKVIFRIVTVHSDKAHIDTLVLLNEGSSANMVYSLIDKVGVKGYRIFVVVGWNSR